MPVVAMPDGTQVNMPDKVDPATQQRLRAVLDKQKAITQPPVKGKKMPLLPEIEEAMRSPKQRADGLGYAKEISLVERMGLAQADNVREGQKFLEATRGKANVKALSDGTLAVREGDKWAAVTEGSRLDSTIAGMLANSPVLGGMAFGGVEGAAAAAKTRNPWAVGIATVGGAVLGARAGKSVQEINKIVRGDYDKTEKEAAAAATDTDKSAVVGELGGRAVTGVISKIARGPLPSLLTGVTPETKAMVERVLDGGGRPHAQESMPNLKHVQFMEALAAKTVGPLKAQTAANETYIRNRMRSVLRESGVPEAHIDTAIKELSSGDSRVPTSDIGDHVKAGVAAHKEMLEGQVTNALKNAQTQIDTQMNHLDVMTRRFKTDGLGVNVAEGIKQARDEFGKAFAVVYKKIDSLVGDKPLVPSRLINKTAKELIQKTPAAAQQGLLKELSRVGIDLESDIEASIKGPKPQASSNMATPKAEPKISFATAQRIRTLIGEKLAGGNLTPGLAAHEMSSLLDATNYSIQAASKDPLAAPAVKMLNEADKRYAAGIARFNDTTVNRLVSDMRAGIAPNPETVAATIIQPKYAARVQEIKKLVGQETWNKVAGADYTNLITGATDSTGAVSGIKLLKAVTDRSKLMTEIYGARTAGEITELARTVAAKDGHLSVEDLAPGKAKETLAVLKAEQKTLDDFMKKNALSELVEPKKNPEQAYKWLVREDNGVALANAVKLLGKDSPQIKGVQQAALKELLATAKVEVASGRPEDGLTKALGKYSAEQQKLLFPNGMDSDLHLLGKEIQFLMKNLSDEAKASFAAGITLHLPFPARIPLQVGEGLYQVLLSQPAVIRYLAVGLRSPAGEARQMTKEMLKTLIRYGDLPSQDERNRTGNEK